MHIQQLLVITTPTVFSG